MAAHFKNGFLDLCVLASLREQDSYGYKILSVIAPYIEISESTLYPILRRLETNGSVTTRTEAYNGRLRKYFRITAVGMAKIKEFEDTMYEFNKISKFILKGEEK